MSYETLIGIESIKYRSGGFGIGDSVVRLALQAFKNKRPCIDKIIGDGRSKEFVEGIERIVRSALDQTSTPKEEKKTRLNGDPLAWHQEAMIFKIRPYFYSGNLFESYCDALDQEYRPENRDIIARFKVGLSAAIMSLLGTGIGIHETITSILSHQYSMVSVSGMATIGIATLGLCITKYYLKPFFSEIRERSCSAIRAFQDSGITRAAALVAACWAHDSREDGYWPMIKEFIEQGDFGDAGRYVTKVVDLLTRGPILDRVIQYSMEIDQYLTEQGLTVEQFLLRQKHGDELRIENKLKIIRSYTLAAYLEPGADPNSKMWSPEMNFEEMELGEKDIETIESILSVVRSGDNIAGSLGEYFHVDLRERENYSLMVLGMANETDPYVREGAILIKKADSAHNLDTLPSSSANKQRIKYILQSIIFDLPPSIYFCTLEGQARIHESARREVNALRGVGCSRYAPSQYLDD